MKRRYGGMAVVIARVRSTRSNPVGGGGIASGASALAMTASPTSTACPPVRRSAYLWTQLVTGRLRAITPNALFALWISGRSWKPLRKLGPQDQSTDAHT